MPSVSHSRKRPAVLPATKRGSDASDRRAARKPVNLHRVAPDSLWSQPLDYEQRTRFVRPASADLWPPRHRSVDHRPPLLGSIRHYWRFASGLERAVISIAAAVLAAGAIIWLI